MLYQLSHIRVRAGGPTRYVVAQTLADPGGWSGRGAGPRARPPGLRSLGLTRHPANARSMTCEDTARTAEAGSVPKVCPCSPPSRLATNRSDT
jgi:hypothetical protein